MSSIVYDVFTQGFRSIAFVGAALGIAAFVIVLCMIFGNPNASQIPAAPGEAITMGTQQCNGRVIFLGPTGVDATARLPPCGAHATIELQPAQGWPASSPGSNGINIQSPSGSAVQTNAGDDVRMTYIRKVSCNSVGGIWSCVVAESA